MEVKFDIFRRQSDGHPLWMKAVEGLEEARLEIAQIAKQAPGEYFIYDTRNGNMIPVESRDTGVTLSERFDIDLSRCFRESGSFRSRA